MADAKKDTSRMEDILKQIDAPLNDDLNLDTKDIAKDLLKDIYDCSLAAYEYEPVKHTNASRAILKYMRTPIKVRPGPTVMEDEAAQIYGKQYILELTATLVNYYALYGAKPISNLTRIRIAENAFNAAIVTLINPIDMTADDGLSKTQNLANLVVGASVLASIQAACASTSEQISLTDRMVLKQVVDHVIDGDLQFHITKKDYPYVFVREEDPDEPEILSPYTRQEIERVSDAIHLYIVASEQFQNLHDAINHLFDTYDEIKKEHEDLVSQRDEAQAILNEKIEEVKQQHASKIQQLTEQLADANNLIKALKEDVDTYQKLLEEAEAETAREKQRVQDALKELAAVPTENATETSPFAHLVLETDLIKPKSAEHAVELAQTAFSDKLAFANKALNDAAEYYGNAEEVWQALRALATTWWQAAHAKRQLTYEQSTVAMGFEISPNESKATRNNNKLMQQRRATLNGKTYTATHHLKGRNSAKGMALRIYFLYDDELDKIVICRCGNHLETIGSKRWGI